MTSLAIGSEMSIHPFWAAQLASLITDEASVAVSINSNFADMFSPESAVELPKHTRINDHSIKLIENWQPSYRPIYNLGPVELETLKIYIKANLANGFICLSKSPAGTPILFVQKPDGSFWLCIDYWDLNNLTIKNWYPLLLIGKLLDWLGWTRHFT